MGGQIEDVGRNGRHVIVRAASRLGMEGEMDAMCWSERRPYWGCGAEWTPCADVGGVQNWDVGRNGRHVLMCVASRSGMLRGMDASVLMRAASRLMFERKYNIHN